MSNIDSLVAGLKDVGKVQRDHGFNDIDPEPGLSIDVGMFSSRYAFDRIEVRAHQSDEQAAATIYEAETTFGTRPVESTEHFPGDHIFEEFSGSEVVLLTYTGKQGGVLDGNRFLADYAVEHTRAFRENKDGSWSALPELWRDTSRCGDLSRNMFEPDKPVELTPESAKIPGYVEDPRTGIHHHGLSEYAVQSQQRDSAEKRAMHEFAGYQLGGRYAADTVQARSMKKIAETRRHMNQYAQDHQPYSGRFKPLVDLAAFALRTDFNAQRAFDYANTEMKTA